MNEYTSLQRDLEIINDILLASPELREEFFSITELSEEEFNKFISGEVTPDKIELEKIYNFAYGRKLYMNEITWQTNLDDYRSEEVKVLAHGAKNNLQGEIRLDASGVSNDFANGFYLGESLAQAGMWVADEINSSLYILTLNTSELKQALFNVSTDWMLAVSYFRGKLEGYEEHPRIRSIARRVNTCDYVYAPIADNKLFEVIDAFAAGEITDLQCLYAISATMLGYQYVLKSERALENLEIKEHLYYCNAEKSLYSQERDIETNTSMNKALIAKKKYADQGKYISELLGSK